MERECDLGGQGEGKLQVRVLWTNPSGASLFGSRMQRQEDAVLPD
jgi:hypothetical protein